MWDETPEKSAFEGSSKARRVESWLSGENRPEGRLSPF